jgi:hypothetical protein
MSADRQPKTIKPVPVQLTLLFERAIRLARAEMGKPEADQAVSAAVCKKVIVDGYAVLGQLVAEGK